MAKNPKELLAQALKFPAAIEDMLPEGAPSISSTLADAVDKLPVLPDLPVEVPDLPEPPALPSPVEALARARVTPTVTEPAVPAIARKGRTRFLY